MKNCYFYTTRKENKTYVVPLCIECHDTSFAELGWFWAGEELGYGPFLFQCEKCQKTICDNRRDDENVG